MQSYQSIFYQEKDIKSNSESGQFVTRVPISIFSKVKEAKGDEKSKFENLLKRFKEKIPPSFKIGAAVGMGDCFFDSVAQGLNELKDKGLITGSKNFDVKSLREICASFGEANKDKIVSGAKAEGYFVAQENYAFPKLGNIQVSATRMTPS